MGNINQSWRDTMALMGRRFTKEEHAAGWPESFQIEHIARLQRPYKLGDLEAKRLLKSFFDGLKAACRSGELTHSVQSKEAVDSYRTDYAVNHVENSCLGRATEHVTRRKVPVYKLKDCLYVSAPVFKTWLAAQGEQPSPHIQAWFCAMGLNDVSTDAKRAKEDVAHRNGRWLAQLDAAKACASPPSDASIYRQIEAVEGIPLETIKKAVNSAKKARDAKCAEGNIKPLTRGKKAKNTLSSVWGNRIGK